MNSPIVPLFDTEGEAVVLGGGKDMEEPEGSGVEGDSVSTT